MIVKPDARGSRARKRILIRAAMGNNRERVWEPLKAA